MSATSWPAPVSSPVARPRPPANGTAPAAALPPCERCARAAWPPAEPLLPRGARPTWTRCSSAGAGDLHDFLRHHYAGGASLDALSRRAGLGRARLRTELTAAGVGVRRSGVNNPASKHARAHNIDAQVAARVGAEDIRVWLRSQRANGTTIQALARQTQRSIPWIQSRLASQRAQHPDRQ